MVRLRLRREGRRKRPSYRVVAADSRMPRDGRFIEVIGFYDPLVEPPKIVISEDKALLWLKRGAQPSETVQRLLVKTGILAKFRGEAPAEASAPAEAASPEQPA